MLRFIKNTSGTTSTYVGQQINNNAYYQIQDSELLAWQTDSTLLTDIGNGDATVAKDDSGNNDITIVATAIAYLRDEVTKEVISTSQGLKEPGNYRARLQKLCAGVATKNTNTNFDYKMTQLSWQGTNKNSYFDGVQYKAINADVSDYVTFQIVDKDGIVYAAGTVLEEFAQWNIIPNSTETIRLFKSKMIPDMYIRIIYTSTSTTTDVDFICNLYQFMKTDEDS